MKDIFVWDLPTRVGHWALAALVALAWASSEWIFTVHAVSGYAILVILLFRIQWGVLGNERARFADFVRPWPEVRDYARRLLALSPPRTLGHNPLGGWMILALLGTVLLVVATGLFSAKKSSSGPLADLLPGMGRTMAEVHEGLTSLLGFLIAVHVAAVFFDWFLTGDNLVRAMITGRKELTVAEEGAVASPARPWAVAVAAVVSIVAVWLVVAG